MIPFGVYDTETHNVLQIQSIHFNVSSVCHTLDIKAVHKFLLCLAQHVYVHHCACSCDPRTNILQVYHLSVAKNIFHKPPQKNNQVGLCLVIVGARQLIHLGQSSDVEIFHSRRLE